MNNNGIKVMLVILIVICLFQGCGLANMTEEIENMNHYISQMENDMQYLSNRIKNLEASLEQESILMDWSYGIADVDWENGNIHVACQVMLRESQENTRVVVENGKGTYELTSSGNSYTGTVIYPIDNSSYETVVYKYNGDVLVDSEAVENLGADSLLCKYLLCDFYGMSYYGNGKLTLAGNVEYYSNIEENVTAAKLVCVDEEIELKNYKQGQLEINVSKPLAEPQKTFYLEIQTESGMLFRTYLGLCITESYQVSMDEESVLMTDAMSVLEVITPTGKTYEIEWLQ